LKKAEFNAGRRIEEAKGAFSGDAPATEVALESDKRFLWMNKYYKVLR
jgi:hypothetical protein